jgi:hypothetical protein
VQARPTDCFDLDAAVIEGVDKCGRSKPTGVGEQPVVVRNADRSTRSDDLGERTLLARHRSAPVAIRHQLLTVLDCGCDARQSYVVDRIDGSDAAVFGVEEAVAGAIGDCPSPRRPWSRPWPLVHPRGRFRRHVAEEPASSASAMSSRVSTLASQSASNWRAARSACPASAIAQCQAISLLPDGCVLASW